MPLAVITVFEIQVDVIHETSHLKVRHKIRRLNLNIYSSNILVKLFFQHACA